MLQAFLRVFARGLLAIVGVLWSAILLPTLHAIGGGIAMIVRRLAPWVIGGISLLWLIHNEPDVANALLTLVVIVGIAYVGFRRVSPREHQNRRH